MKITAEINRLGYRAIPDELQQILFPDAEETISRLELERIKSALASFGLELPTDQTSVSLDVPDFAHILDGKSPRQFLDTVVLSKYRKVKEIVSEFLGTDSPSKLTSKTIRENLNPGWTRFAKSGEIATVETPLEQMLVSDVETYVKRDSYPVMAAAVSSQAIYVWLHPSLLNDQPFTPMLIPTGENKIILNHNVSYDAAKFQESYYLTQNKLTFLDTMSMHIAVAGMGNQQRRIFDSHNKNFGAKWRAVTSGNSLVSVYNLHVKPEHPLTEDDKSIRNIFVYGDLPLFKENLIDLIRYNIDDCLYTKELGSKLWFSYLYANPELFTLAGHIQLNSSVLPVVNNWKQWVFHVNNVYAQTTQEVNKMLTELAYNLEENKPTDPDVWDSQLDWTEAKTGKNKGKSAWFRKQILSQIKKKGKYPVSSKSGLAPLLLKMSWLGQPLYKTKKSGWCYIVGDAENDLAFIDKESGLRVAKIPHPKGETANCGNPLAKDYIKYIEDGTLSSEDPRAKEIMHKAKSLSYWSSMHSRVEEFNPEIAIDTKTPLIKPGIVAHGTVTRRAVEATWLTCSDIKPNIIGSELKSRVQAPEGYLLVGADFDSQEMKIGATKADAFLGIHGSSPMSLTQMVGDKDAETDSHSLLAKDLSLWPDRQLAKTLNFLMLFFGGVKGLFEAIKTARGELKDSEAKRLANKAIKLRRGTKDRESGLYKGGTDSHAYNYMMKLANTLENRTVLGRSAISKPLQKSYCGSEFMPSRCNRSIQSAGVDILHVFVSFLEYFIELFKIDGKFLISIHDEVWSIVKEGQEKEMVWVFQLSHLLTWSIFYEAYGFSTIPFNYLFFSGVNVDKVLRKEVNNVGVKIDGQWVYKGLETPSNVGPEIEPGKAYKPNQLGS